MNVPRSFAALALLAASTAVLAAPPELPPSAEKSAPVVPVSAPAEPAKSAGEKKSPAGDGATVTANATTSPVSAATTTAAATAGKLKGPPPMPKGPMAPPPLSPRFLQVRARIDALFSTRNDPPPPPDARSNPFRPPGAVAAPIATADGTVVSVPVNRDLTVLQQAVATLKVKATLERREPGSRSNPLRLVISSGPGKESTYKEGDVISVNLGGDPAPLRVRQITRNSVTLTLNDAEMTLKF